ncbi:hypothetical protein COY87_05260 [Candidatus Roizmanbacteria bacterium CG_4_10_14_0_8_um_filter_33_9]|uniref:Cell division protein FtsX n=1 Tax=Candidatus Roizmanbacteria bacterium CG_4_10_14_0_8_um_filter_33_9 TaxID=1974826 RepID=A0A2M7QHV7_9BACT|nr:MAG: hypothetical protein COY87_05260 [Candidatus Roizmanbacteria bacterium CG_4_10_14_0_8_um_filter_33_9]
MNSIFTTIRRAPYQSLATFLSLVLTLFLSLSIFFLLSFLYGLLGYVESRPQVTVYFQTQTSESDILKIKDNLISSGKILSAKYISKDDAFKIYKDLNKDNPLLLEMITPDILPASLEIFATKPSFLPQIADFLNKQPGVDEVNFQKLIIDKLLALTSILRKVSLGFFTYLLISTIFILITITHFKIALKKDEIELLQLLGASRGYVRKPYLKEALLFGFASATIVYAVFISLFFLTRQFTESYLTGINNLQIEIASLKITVWPLGLEFALILYAITLLFGIIISLFSTSIALRKYIQ